MMGWRAYQILKTSKSLHREFLRRGTVGDTSSDPPCVKCPNHNNIRVDLFLGLTDEVIPVFLFLN